MTDVFLCKTGQLNVDSRRDLKRAGVVVVEVDDPSACQFIRAAEVVSGDDMLWAAMDAIKRDFGYGDHGAKQREQFAMNVYSMVAAARRERAGDPAPGKPESEGASDA